MMSSLPSVKKSSKSNGQTRPATNTANKVIPSRPIGGVSSFGRPGQQSLRSDRRGRLINALSIGGSKGRSGTIDLSDTTNTTTTNPTAKSNGGRRRDISNSDDRMKSFVNNVSSKMFQLQPANVKQYDPSWMSERLDEIMGNVSGSQTSTSPTKKNPRLKTRTTKVASPSVQKKWAKLPNTPVSSSSNGGTSNNDIHGMTVESVPSSPERRKTRIEEENGEEEKQVNENYMMQEMTSPFAAEVLSLTTGDDVIKFFARHGNECPVRFFYLKRPIGALDGIQIRPYDLEVVMVGQIADSDLEFPPLPFILEKKECFTMSSKGVVHLEPGHPSEFIVLSTWLRHATIFNVLTSIPFFKSFRVYKLFHKWHKSSLRSKFLKLQKNICKSLFLGRPTFCKPLLHISGLLNDVRDVDLIDFKVPSSLSKSLTNIKKYTEYQSTKRMEGKKIIEENIEKCQMCIEAVISQVTGTLFCCCCH